MKTNENNLRQNKAITLIALVVTIVILIILASVAITMSLSNTGIFNRTKQAKEDYQTATNDEIYSASKLTNDVDNYVSSSRNDLKVPDYRDNLVLEYTMKNIIGNDIQNSILGGPNATISGSDFSVGTSGNRNFLHLGNTSSAATSSLTQFAGTPNISMTCMFRTDVKTGYPAILTLGSVYSRNGALAPHVYNGKFRFDTGSNIYSYDSQMIDVSDSNWHFLCLTFNKQTIAIYIDDIPIYATAGTVNITSPTFSFGGTVSNGTSNFQGDISDIRVYSTALNVEQVYRIYTNTKY